MAGLEITIGGDASGFNSELNKVEDKLRRLQTQREVEITLGLDTTRIDRSIQQTTERLARLRGSLSQTGQSIQGFRQQTANGSNTLTQFSRIAQDAPFGIIGIGNNLTATAEAFSNLSRSAGGTGNALRAVGQSLIGGGGILLAISLVTTGLTYMSQKGLTVGDVFNKLTGNFDAARHSMQQLNAEAAKNAQADISGMNAYVSVAKDVNLTMEERLIAVKKLQDEYPAYFGNLTKEQILNGNVAGAVREVTKALINKAKAAAMVEKIVVLAEEEEKIQSRINNSILATAKAYKLNQKEVFELSKLLNEAARSGQKWSEAISGTAFDRLNKYSILQQIAILRTLDGFNDLGAELRSNLYQQDKLTQGIERTTAASIKLEAVKEKAAKKANVTPQVQELEVPIKIKPLIDLNGAQIKTAMTSIVQPVSDEFVRLLELLDSFNKSASDLITGSIASTFSDLGTAIGESLANGTDVISAIGKSLISSLAGFISSMGDLLIKYGTLAVAKGVIDKALTSGNPAVTIAAGAAAIAVGVALKAAGGAISTKASGSGNSSPSTGAGYSSPASRSSVSGGNSSFSNGSVVFEISGSSLIGVLRNTYDQNLRLGGANGL